MDYSKLYYYLIVLSLLGLFIAISFCDLRKNDSPNDAIFGNWDSTGLAILFVGLPLVTLHTIKTLHM